MDETASPCCDEDLSVDDTLVHMARGSRNSDVLGALCFSAETTHCPDFDFPRLHVILPRLDRAEPAHEVWRSGGLLTNGEQGDVHYCHDQQSVFGVIVVAEDRFAAEAGSTPLQRATESAYRQVFSVLDDLSMPNPFRFWNYVPEINTPSYGIERYQQFNSGRQAAFLAHARDVQGNLPAACALGTQQGALSIAFLAGRALPQGVENPRQVSAFNYPRQYGPSSPTFSRASLVKTRRGEILMISGTASVVGHASRHQGDVAAQTRESMVNVEAVRLEANRLSTRGPFAPGELNYRIYLRRPDDLATVRAEMTRWLGESFKAVYLQSDICREELLVEIEATAVSSKDGRE